MQHTCAVGMPIVQGSPGQARLDDEVAGARKALLNEGHNLPVHMSTGCVV